MTLPEGVDTDKVQAACDEGMLEISMPIVKKTPSSRKIAIGSSSGKEGKVHH
ncbi:MAG: hypothetical protein C0623_06755 [Desulfuromonas sp.]|nr:MAG: hypothetical protein C0623_06755 [Desulfuromonas sp.]